MSHFAKARSSVRIRNAGVRASASHAHVYAGASEFGFLNNLNQQQAMTQHAEQLQHNVGYTYSIVRTIANTIAGQRFYVGRVKPKQDKDKDAGKGWRRKVASQFVPKSLQHFSDDIEVQAKHPFLDTINRPNPLMGKFALINNTFTCLELCGIMYWWFRFPGDDGDEEIETPQIWPIPPSWVEPQHEGGKLFSSYKICPEGFVQPIIVPGKSIGMFYYPDPANPVRPLSPMQALARTVMVDEQIEECQRRHFLNSHNPGLAVIVGKLPGTEGLGIESQDPILTKAQRAQITDALNQEWRGAKNYNNPIILDGMIKDVKKITNTPQQMDYGESGKLAKERLAQCWGISPVILGDMQNANRAGSTVAKKHFYDIVCNPRIAMFSEAMTHQIIPMFDDNIPDEDTVAWVETLVAVDEDYQLAVHEAMMDRDAMKINEWRTSQGMEPFEDGDVTLSEWRSTQGFSLTPSISISEDEPLPGPSPTEEDDTDTDADTNTDADGKSFTKSWHDHIGVSGHAQTLGRHASKSERELARAMQAFFIGMGQAIGDTLRQHAKSSSIVDSGIVDLLVHDSEWIEKMTAVARPIMLRAALASAVVEWNMHHPRHLEHAANTLQRKGLFGITINLPKAIVAKVTEAVGVLVKKMHVAEILETIRSKIKRGIDAVAGSPGSDVADAVVKSVFSATETQSHANSIASTENTGAFNAGGKAAQDELGRLGLVNGRKWMTMRDDVVRPSHQEAGRQKAISLHEKFTVGGYEAEFPGDPDLPPKEKCNCRCFVLSVKVKR